MKRSEFDKIYFNILRKENRSNVFLESVDNNNDDDLYTVTFKTSDKDLIDALNSGFETISIFTNAKDEATDEDNVVEVKFGKDSFGELEIINPLNLDNDTSKDDNFDEECDECGDEECNECDKEGKDDEVAECNEEGEECPECGKIGDKCVCCKDDEWRYDDTNFYGFDEEGEDDEIDECDEEGEDDEVTEEGEDDEVDECGDK